MFTGLVTHVGRIARIESEGGLVITAPQDFFTAMQPGESIAVQGVCLTVIAIKDFSFAVQVSPETLSCTCGLDAPGPVNLERALRLMDRMGGHWVSGHVDGVAEVTGLVPEKESMRLTLSLPKSLGRYLARKGSLAVDGVSLTIADGRDASCDIVLVPHTLQHTTLQQLTVGSRVNVEVDILARYLERLQQ